jgi:hypothetical protein
MKKYIEITFFALIGAVICIGLLDLIFEPAPARVIPEVKPKINSLKLLNQKILTLEKEVDTLKNRK